MFSLRFPAWRLMKIGCNFSFVKPSLPTPLSAWFVPNFTHGSKRVKFMLIAEMCLQVEPLVQLLWKKKPYHLMVIQTHFAFMAVRNILMVFLAPLHPSCFFSKKILRETKFSPWSYNNQEQNHWFLHSIGPTSVLFLWFNCTLPQLGCVWKDARSHQIPCLSLVWTFLMVQGRTGQNQVLAASVYTTHLQVIGK